MKLILFGIFCVASLIKADIIDDKAIEVSGSIQCCRNNDQNPPFPRLFGNCEAPAKARIELWDYFKVLPSVRLHWLEIEKQGEYSFRWADGKIFDVKPFLKIHVECSDGTIMDEKYDFTDAKSQNILQNVEVVMPPPPPKLKYPFPTGIGKI
uniref:Uncharacterized protein n=1 Tax=Panagrolaimus superbus TaxID=310955 RepID=A0A914ZDG0_9BILA